MKKKISIVSICYNENELIEDFEKEVLRELSIHKEKYDYEVIVADNSSTDGTIEKLREICARNKNFKVIINNKNYGEDRSSFNAMKQAQGDLIITLHTDLEEPANVITKFLSKWEEGCKYAVGQKKNSNENFFYKLIKNFYYFIYNKFSSTKIIPNTALMMLDKSLLKYIINIEDPEPFNRGIFNELFHTPEIIQINKTIRQKGSSKNNLFTLYNYGITGLVKTSKIPLRVLTFFGLLLSLFFILIGLFFFIYKILFWDSFTVGIAPLIILLCIISSFLLMSLGLIGEYISVVLSFAKKLPTVIERERINF
jgi:glycosyltransferase involved in cell wall biosynthesis